MMDAYTLMRVNKDATRRSQKARKEPAVWQGSRDDFRIPFIGSRTPRGWKRTDREEMFVDTSGWGAPGEMAMTQSQMFAAMTVGKGYGLTESGQFQGYLAEFVRR